MSGLGTGIRFIDIRFYMLFLFLVQFLFLFHVVSPTLPIPVSTVSQNPKLGTYLVVG